MSTIQELVAQGMVQQAAELAEHQGELARASDLFEQACAFERAARCALGAGDLQRAVLLSSMTSDQALIASSIEALRSSPAQARATATLLAARGRSGCAALVWEAVGERRAAAEAWEGSGDAVRAAAGFEACGEPREAARVLEAALAADPESAPALLALGALLVRSARHEAAVRILQKLPRSSSEYERGLPLLASCFEALGLDGPREAVQRDARRQGIELVPDAAPAAAAEPGVLFGRYEIVRTAASTPSARVFEAVDRLSRGRVALKQVAAASMVGSGRDAFGRLVREARILQQLRHPNVVPLLDLIEDAGAIVTPWMTGGSLAARLASEPLAPARAVEIACAVLGALAEAHRLGILHRDLKPSNILFDEAGVTMLADFGAAHMSDASATATAGVIGTLAYMSPEQRAGKPATPASDVFGVGATLLEMLTGSPPAGDGSGASPSHAHPELGEQHDVLVAAMLHESPAQRPASALAARQSLLSVSWPSKPAPAAWRRRPPIEESASLEARLQVVSGRVCEDRWLGRRVVLVERSDAVQRVARAYAAAACDELPAVVRATPDGVWFWFEEPGGVRLAQYEGPAPRWAALRQAVERLHRCGAAHGSIDELHVYVGPEGSLRLALEPATMLQGTSEQDLRALDSLASR